MRGLDPGVEEDLEVARMLALIVSPDDLRFTQDSIAIKFRYPYDFLRIDDAVEQLQKGLLAATVFTPMNVVRHNGTLWSLDNRRLWVFRRARVQQVTVNIVSSSYSERSRMFFMNLDAQLERDYCSPLYYPRVRGRVRSSIFNTARFPTTVSPPSPYKSSLGRESTSNPSSWNTHRPDPDPVPLYSSSSSAGSWPSQGASRPGSSYTGSYSGSFYTGSHSGSSYTGSHSGNSNSATNDNSQVSIFDIFKKVIDFFKRL